MPNSSRYTPYVNDVLLVDTKSWRKSPFKRSTWKEIQAFRRTLREVKYDVVFDLQGNVKSGLIVSQAFAKQKVGFGKETVAESPNLLFTNRRFNPPAARNIRDDYLYLAQSFLQDTDPYKNQGVMLKLDGKQQASLQMALKFPAFQEPYKVMVCPGLRGAISRWTRGSY